MIISDVSIKRPVFATVISLLILVFGFSGLMKLPVREYPDIDPPQVSVSVNYVGAAPEVIDTQIIQVIEGAISGVEGVRRIESRSRLGSARTNIEFTLARDIDVAANDVRDAVSRVLVSLPEEADAPVIAKADSDARPIIWVTLTSDSLDAAQLSDYAERNLVDRFSVLDGVADIFIGGERRYAMRIWLDRTRMAARAVTVSDIEGALRANNIELPGGKVESDSRDFTVRADSRMTSADEFRRLVIRRDGRHLIRLGEVADVEQGVEDDDTLLRANGQVAIGLGVIRQSKSNTVAVSDAVQAEIKKVEENLPPDIRLSINYDESLFIRASIREVLITLGISVVLVICVIWVFLGSWRATLIPAVTIPVSIIGAFAGLAALDFSLNVLTLLALILAIGLVVDDAIVMLENIQRRMDLGEPPLVAAFLGARQVAFAVIATTLTLIAVFVPISFMGGDTGRLFSEFGFTLSAAVLVSSLVALSLAPMLCSRWLKAHEKGSSNSLLERFFTRLTARYETLLDNAINKPSATVSLALLVCVLGAVAFTQLPRELAPTEDRGIFIVPGSAPQGSTAEYTAFHAAKVEEKLLPLVTDGVAERVLSIVGFRGQSTSAITIVRLAPWEERDVKQQDIVAGLQGELRNIPGLRTFAVNPPGLGQRGFSKPLEVVVGAPDYLSAKEWSETLLAAAKKNPMLIGVDTDYEETQPQLNVKLLRDRAGDQGITAQDVGLTLQAMLASVRVTTYLDRGREYDVMIEARPEDRASPQDLNNIYLRANNSDKLVALSSVTELQERGAAPELRRIDRLPAVTLDASLAPGYDMGTAIQFFEDSARELLPPEARLSYKGLAREFTEASTAILATFILALVIVFLVLAAQFESWIHPLIIMLTVPLAIAGAAIAIWVTGDSLNIYSQIGLIMLVGLMAKNGILIVEFANQLRDEGRDIATAIREGAVVRFRPVLMTGISTIFGALPLVVASGAGAESRITIGVVILGGLLFATVLTLFIIPILYNWLARYTQSADAITHALDDAMRKGHYDEESTD
ncbi:MAG: efflux RND transporter permease subunit [Alcanivoracaceae bacterium]|nr:efflux RND transporter permease subunit [Alcanivoracaceae bacterium]